ncbi:TIGR00297 family protein [Methanocaldococcus sp.]
MIKIIDDEIMLKLIVSIIVIIILALLIKKSKCLDDKGIICSSLMGFILLYFCGFEYLILLLSFFILGVIVSKIGKEKKKNKNIYESSRSLKNVLANGLIPLIFAILTVLGFKWALFGYVSSIAAATSDTFSSELGVLSNENPRLITTFEVVEKGTDGAITIFGLVAGLLGAFIIGVIGYLCFKNSNIIICSVIGGISGNLADSIVGALFERRGILNNEHVNLIATIVGGIIGVLVVKIL